MRTACRPLLRSTAAYVRPGRRVPSAVAAAVPFRQDESRNFSEAAGSRRSKGNAAEAATGRSRELDIVLRALDAPRKQEPPISDEEKARREKIFKDYTVGMFRRHNEMYHDIACKLKLKQHALKMIPRSNQRLMQKAFEDAYDDERDRPVLWRKKPTWTPPVPGFDPSVFDEEEE